MRKLILYNDSSIPSGRITKTLYFFDWEIGRNPDVVVNDEGTFVANQYAVFPRDVSDGVQGWGGAAYTYGAATAYDIAALIQEHGERLGTRIAILRIWHEILHHFDQPADRMDDWLAEHPIYRRLWKLTDSNRPMGTHIQMRYYRYLTKQIPDWFDEENSMRFRDYRGCLT